MTDHHLQQPVHMLCLVFITLHWHMSMRDLGASIPMLQVREYIPRASLVVLADEQSASVQPLCNRSNPHLGVFILSRQPVQFDFLHNPVERGGPIDLILCRGMEPPKFVSFVCQVVDFVLLSLGHQLFDPF